MIKSVWVVNVETYDPLLGGTKFTQKEFESLQEAFAFFKKSKSHDFQYYDSHWNDDGYQSTRQPFHVFVYENEERAKQQKIRAERRKEKALKAWGRYEGVHVMTKEEAEKSGVRDATTPWEDNEPIFNDDDVEF